MRIHKAGAETVLKELYTGIKAEAKVWRALHLSFDLTLTDVEFQTRIKIIEAFLAEWIGREEGHAFLLRDGDIIIMFKGASTRIVTPLKDNLKQIKPEGYDLSKELPLYDLSMTYDEFGKVVDHKITIVKGIKASNPNSSHSRSALDAFAFDADVYAKAVQGRAERRKLVVLVVDDDIFSRRLVSNSLDAEHEVVQAGNAVEALQKFTFTAPDIVFLDIDLPDSDGHKILEKFMSIDSSAFIVMLSGNSTREDIMKALGNGAKGFIGKPFTKDKLLMYIKQANEQVLETT